MVVLSHVVQTSAVTLSTEELVLADASGGDFDITLPNANSNLGRVYYIKRLPDANNHSVNLVCGTGDTLDSQFTSILIPNDPTGYIVGSTASGQWSTFGTFDVPAMM